MDSGPVSIGAVIPKRWPGWLRNPAPSPLPSPPWSGAGASPPRQPGTPLALPKCLIKGICGAAEPGCNLVLTVHLFQRLRQPAKVVGSLITERQAAGRSGEEERLRASGRQPKSGKCIPANEGNAFCPRGPQQTQGAFLVRRRGGQPTRPLAAQ